MAFVPLLKVTARKAHGYPNGLCGKANGRKYQPPIRANKSRLVFSLYGGSAATGSEEMGLGTYVLRHRSQVPRCCFPVNV
jgi:hypothetical protein